jgi:DNA polymerase-1
MVAEAVAVQTEFVREGVVYRCGDSIAIRLTPKRKNRWQVTVYQGEVLLDTIVLDPADKAQREKVVRGLTLEAVEADELRRLFLYAADKAAEDGQRWNQWQAQEAAEALLQAAREAQVMAEAERQAKIAAAWERGHAILQSAALLYEVGQLTKRLGLAGEEVNSRLLYLGLTSRIAAKPINIAVKGESSAGKSHTVKTVLRLFPKEAFIELTAMSEHALVYAPEEFAHRFVIIYEHCGQETADYFIRTLQSEGKIRYWTVMSTPAGPVGTLIEKDGPTGFVTTTTQLTLHDENETRLWSLFIDETPEQTAAVIQAVASSYNSRQVPPALEPWLAAQEWLALAGTQRALISYADWLAKRMPHKPLRIRRDFGRFLALVEGSALLFQAQREKTEDDCIIATVHDYANAVTLAAVIFGEALLSVPAKTRQLLDVIDELHRAKVEAEADELTVSYQDVTFETGKDKKELSRALRPAIEKGLLENLESRRGMPARLRPHLELLKGSYGLPSAEELAAAFPGLAGGIWVNPLTGEEKNFSPDTPATPATPVTPQSIDTTSVAGNGATPVVAEPEGVATVATVAAEPKRKSFVYVTDPEELAKVGAHLSEASVLGLDLETFSPDPRVDGGLDPHAGAIRLINLAMQTTDPDTGVPAITAFLIDTLACPNWTGALAPALTNPGTIKVTHNGKFDLKFLMAAGVPIANVFDTMLAAQILDSGQHLGEKGHFTLAAVATRYLGESLDKSQQASDWGAPQLSGAQLEYAANDALILVQLYDCLREKLERVKLGGAAELEMSALPAIAWLEFAGAPFDADAWVELSEKALSDKLVLEGEIVALLGVPNLNLDSPKQVRVALEATGIVVPNTNEETLTEVADRQPVIGKFLAYREASKRANTYGIEFLKHIQSATGRIHANYLQIGAATGRMSCREPNLQNIPREPAYRACVRPREGRVLVKVDLSLIELCVAAGLSRDDNMIRAIAEGQDLHRLTAAALFRKPAEEVATSERAFGKSVNFGTLYGQGKKGLMEKAALQGLDITEAQAAELQRRFAQAWPKLAAWQRRQMQSTNSSVRTASGRRRRLVGKDDRGTVRANTPVQGTAADGFKAALALLFKTRSRVPSAVPVLAVHDELVVECDEGDAEAVAEWVSECLGDGMRQFIDNVPISVDVTIAPTWGGNGAPDGR